MGMGSTIAGLMLSIYMPMFEMAGNPRIIESDLCALFGLSWLSP